MIRYTPYDWYWQVAGDVTWVYSSAQAAYVPVDNEEYIAWQADDSHRLTRIANEAELWEVLEQQFPAGLPATFVPRVVSMRQARLALLQAGILDQVAPAIAALPSPQKEAATIEWEYSQEVHRDRELVMVLGQLLGLSNLQLDQLFITAATL